MRRTYVWDPESQKMIPKEEAFIRASRSSDRVLPDIKDFVTVDGVHIHGRQGLREYQRRTGLEQTGTDTVNGLDEKGQYRRIVQEMPPIQRDVREAWERVSQGYKPRDRYRDE